MPTPRKVAAPLRFIRLRLRCRHFEGRPFFVGPRARFEIGRDARVTVGRHLTLVRDFDGRFRGELVIGNNVWFSPGCTLAIHESVSIGSNCVFAEYVSIHDNITPWAR